MIDRIQSNKVLYYFGMVMLVGGLIAATLSVLTTTQVLGINAYIKPMKFFISVWIFVWTMAYYMSFVKNQSGISLYSWVCTIGLGFELLVIAGQAALGKQSHFNNDTVFDAILFMLMGIVITTVVVWTGLIGFKFRASNTSGISDVTTLSIMLAIFMSVIFAAEGGMMVTAHGHTIGAPDGGPGLPVVNWSTRFGDLRVAHFLGIHALQIVPLISNYFSLRKITTVIFALLYLAFVSATLFQAMAGKPLLSF